MVHPARFILAMFVVPVLAAGAQTAQPAPWPTDEWLKKPVDDKTFETYRGFFTYDRKVPFNVHVLDTTVGDGLVNEHLSFQSTLGVRVFARQFEPLDLRGKRSPAIILLHGRGGEGKDNAGMTEFAKYFAKAGYRVLSIDLPYFGERKTGLVTSFTSDEITSPLYNQQGTYLSFVEQVVRDVGRSYDLLTTERHADPARVALMGASRGAILASIAGAIDRRLAGVALIMPGHMVKEETGHLAAACNANYIGHIAPRPLFVMSATRDVMFPPEQVMALHRLIREPKEITWVDSGHAFPVVENRTPIVKWLQRALR